MCAWDQKEMELNSGFGEDFIAANETTLRPVIGCGLEISDLVQSLVHSRPKANF